MAGVDADERRPEPPLTDAERRKLRSLLDRDDKARWAWSASRTTALWVAAVIGAGVLLSDALGRLLKQFLK